MAGLLSEEKNVYDLYRDYIKHEDTLINYRSSWFGVIQSFLLTGYVFTFHKKYDVALAIARDGTSAKLALPQVLKLAVIQTEVFLLIICIAGMLLSWIAQRSTSAASKALDRLQQHFDEARRKHTFLDELPGPTGGGNRDVSAEGIALGSYFPVAMGGFWLAVLVLTLTTSLLALDVMPLSSTAATQAAPNVLTAPR